MTTLSVDTDLAIPARDGITLASTLVRPAGAGRYPAVLMRTPYDRTTYSSVSLQVHAVRLAEAGYAVVLQDVRGRGASGGVFEPFVSEQADGVDSINWIAEQGWCTGLVGTAGISYNAFAQIAAAAAAPEPLAAWVPGLTPSDVRTSWIRRGGVLDLGFHLAWGLGGIAPLDPRTSDPEKLLSLYADPHVAAARGTDQPQLTGSPGGSWFADWAATDDPYADDPRVPGITDLAAIEVPALVVAGWYDVFSAGSVELRDALRSSPGGSRHRFVAGPWDHSGLPLGRRAGERDFGLDAAVDLHALQVAWFDQHLRGSDEVDDDSVFVTGRDRWIEDGTWKPPTESWTFHLDDVGGLVPGPAPPGTATIEVDPEDPTPVPGGCVFPWEPALRPGAHDQRRRRERPDVAVFRAAVLDAPLLVAGRPACRLTVDPGRPYDAAYVTLSEITHDGPVWNVADGFGRIDPETGEALIELGPVAHEFTAGSAVTLDVAFSGDVRLPPTPGGWRTIHVGSGRSTITLPVAI